LKKEDSAEAGHLQKQQNRQAPKNGFSRFSAFLYGAVVDSFTQTGSILYIL
jgi:hypothetical protein